MLILTRRISEAINVGDNIKFTILDVKGGQVRIGIDAPEEVPINREELRHEVALTSCFRTRKPSVSPDELEEGA